VAAATVARSAVLPADLCGRSLVGEFAAAAELGHLGGSGPAGVSGLRAARRIAEVV